MNVQPITNYSSQKNTSFGAKPLNRAATTIKNCLYCFYRTEADLTKQERMIKALERIQQIGTNPLKKNSDLTFDMKVENAKMVFFSPLFPEDKFLTVSSSILKRPLEFMEKLADRLSKSYINRAYMEANANDRCNFIYKAFFGE